MSDAIWLVVILISFAVGMVAMERQHRRHMREMQQRHERNMAELRAIGESFDA